MKPKSLQTMALGSAVGLVVCVGLSIRIVLSVYREWGNVNSLQLGYAGIFLVAVCWGAFVFGRYALECLARCNEE